MNVPTFLLPDKITDINLKKNGKRTIIRTIMEMKKVMIIQEEEVIEEEVEEEVTIRTKVSIKEIETKVGVQVKEYKIEMRTEISTKIIESKDIKIRTGKIKSQIKAGVLKNSIMTDSLKDLTTTTITGDNKKANPKMTTKKEIITWEKLETKLQVMMKMLIIEQQFIDLNKFNLFIQLRKILKTIKSKNFQEYFQIIKNHISIVPALFYAYFDIKSE